MKYTDGNIIGVEYLRPDTGDVVWTVLEIRRYSGVGPDLVLKRSDDTENYLNTARYVYDQLNNDYWTITMATYEIY